jgi:hypothetical protein
MHSFDTFCGAAASVVVRTHEQTIPVAQAKATLADAAAGVTLELAGAKVAVDAVAGEGTLALTFRVLEGELQQVSLGLHLAMSDWDKTVEPYAPAALYNGNRLKIVSKKDRPLDQLGLDSEPIQNEFVWTLQPGEDGAAQFRAGDMAVPAAALFDPRSKTALVLASSQRADGLPDTLEADTAYRFVESDDQSSAVVEVLAAGVRQKFRRFERPSTDRGVDLVAGDVVTLDLLVDGPSACASPAALHRRLWELRPKMAFLRPPSTTPLLPREVLPFSETFKVQERKFNEQNWVERHGYFSVGLREVESQDWQTGWTGGPNATYPLLADGDAITRRRAAKMFDFIKTGVTPSGFVDGRFDGESGWREGKRLYLRYQADSLYFLTKSLALMKSRGDVIGEGWDDLCRGIADAFVRMWEKHGQIGHYADRETGDLVIGRTCAGGLAPAGLLVAAEIFDEAKYRDAAVAIGDYYRENFTRRAFTNAGPGDIFQAHDSESSFALVASYAHLLEATGESRFAEAARDQAAQAATYVMPYDFDFPTTSTFGKLGMRTVGTVFANVQNKHSAPGICTLSGVSLLRLARATGEREWLDFLAEIAGAIPQYMSRRDRPIRDVRPNQRWPIMPEGWINERINTSDWEVRGDPDEIGVGEIFGGSTWSEGAMLLTRVELPGVYVNTSRGWCVALDHVRATLEDDTLVLENPTRFDAHVKLLIEDDAAMAKPLGPTPLAGERGTWVPANETVRVAIG